MSSATTEAAKAALHQTMGVTFHMLQTLSDVSELSNSAAGGSAQGSHPTSSQAQLSDLAAYKAQLATLQQGLQTAIQGIAQVRARPQLSSLSSSELPAIDKWSHPLFCPSGLDFPM